MIVITIEATAGLIAIILLERLIYICLRKSYGHVNLIYFLAFSFPSLKAIDLACFRELTEANFDADCDSEKDVCSKNGPRLLIVSLIMASISTVFTILLLRFRDKDFDKIRNIEGVEYYRH